MKCKSRFVVCAVLSVLLTPVAAQTTTVEIGPLPLIGNNEVVALAPITLTETTATAWQDGSFTLQWNRPFPTPDRDVFFLEESSASGSVGSPAIKAFGNYNLAVNVDANDQLIDQITVRPVVRVRTETPEAPIGLAYSLLDGTWTVYNGNQGSSGSDPSNIDDRIFSLATVGRTFEIYGGPDAFLNQGAAFSRTLITATNRDRGPYSISASNGAVLDVFESGGEFTVQAKNTLGASEVTIEDSLDGEYSFLVEVIQEDRYPPVDRLAVVDGSSTTATMQLGAAPSHEATYLLEFTDQHHITVLGAIQPEPGHRGQAGEIYIVARAHGRDIPAPGLWFYQDTSGNFVPWDLEGESLRPAYRRAALSADERFEIYSGPLPVYSYSVYIGYLTSSHPLIYSELPLQFRVIPDSEFRR